jgi:HAD superfamily hydrolase (TIGR01509 family)
MNILIPIGGKGERFKKEGFPQPKPLIPVFEKTLFEHVLDNLNIQKDDRVYLFYHISLEEYGFSDKIREKYPCIKQTPIPIQTKGAAETLRIGIETIFPRFSDQMLPCIVLDCDTFYTFDILEAFRQLQARNNKNAVFYTHNTNPQPIYSYIQMDPDTLITEIAEKRKISDNANTGAYGFENLQVLHYYCKQVLDQGIQFNGEPYTSCVISEMIKEGHIFQGLEVDSDKVFSLGTPNELQAYINRTHAFLFDLDGTLVITDSIYYDVWKTILKHWNLTLTPEIFQKYIQGNNDKYVLNTLLLSSSSSSEIGVTELSKWKDELFIEHMDKLKIVPGALDFIQCLRQMGHKSCIVTNCNRKVAEKIVEKLGLGKAMDFIISCNECEHGKPNPEPYIKAIEKYRSISNKQCIIFEDSKSGLTSGKSVHPKRLIGIETLYSKKEMGNYGVDDSMPDFEQIFVEQCLSGGVNSMISEIKKQIMQSHLSVIKVEIDEHKYKGGFIADVLGLTLYTHAPSSETRTETKVKKECVLKYENKSETSLSKMAKQLDLYRREYDFYEFIAPSIPVNIPKFYGLVKDEQWETCGLLLENLTVYKTNVLNLELSKEPIEVSLKIIAKMAKMHGHYWNQNLEKRFPKLKTTEDPCFRPFFKEFIQERSGKFKEKWGNILSEKEMGLFEGVVEEFSEIQRRLAQPPLTFIHGDIKSPNVFYDMANEKEPCFLDWQHCGIGKGTQDLVFFLIESFEPNHFEWLFPLFKNYYYQKLLEYGVKSYTYMEYEKDIRDAICYVPLFTAVWFGTTPNDELIDKNWPYFFIQKWFVLLGMIFCKNV